MYKGIVDSDVHKSDREECRRIIQLLVHAKDETQYKSLKIELYNTTNKAFILRETGRVASQCGSHSNGISIHTLQIPPTIDWRAIIKS